MTIKLSLQFLSVSLLSFVAAACSSDGNPDTTPMDPTPSATGPVGTPVTPSASTTTTGVSPVAPNVGPTGPTGPTGPLPPAGPTGPTGPVNPTPTASMTSMPTVPGPSTTGNESSEPPVSPTTDIDTSESSATDEGTTSTDEETTAPQMGTGSAGCGSQSPLQSGTKMVNIDGTNRQYIIDVPANYDSSNEYMLVFVWHPLGGSASQVANGYDGLKNLANNSAIFVAADGLQGANQEVSGKGWWNANGGDMKLLTSILDEVNTNLCIDQDRIFSTGFSFGGMMSYTVGFEFDVFRAVAPTSGNLDVVPHEKTNMAPLAIMAFHGATDTFVSTAGGRSARDQYIGRNNCDMQTQPVDPNPCVEYQGCEVPTIWCEYDGAHAPWNQMPAAVWAFFSQFE